MMWYWHNGRLYDDEDQVVLESIDGDVCPNGEAYANAIAAVPELILAVQLLLEVRGDDWSEKSEQADRLDAMFSHRWRHHDCVQRGDRLGSAGSRRVGASPVPSICPLVEAPQGNPLRA